MNQVWEFTRQSRSRLRKRIGHSASTVLLVVLFIAVSVAFWRALITETDLNVASQVDYEDATLCTKFGFAAGTEAHIACKSDLLNLRHSDETLLAGTSLP
jgi:hypothetical protein